MIEELAAAKTAIKAGASAVKTGRRAVRKVKKTTRIVGRLIKGVLVLAAVLFIIVGGVAAKKVIYSEGREKFDLKAAALSIVTSAKELHTGSLDGLTEFVSEPKAAESKRLGAADIKEKVADITDSFDDTLDLVSKEKPAASVEEGLPVTFNEESLYIHFIDIGQGDATLITQKGKSILIDTGYYEEVDKLKAYLKSCGITHIDYLVATHPHADHVGSMATMVREFSPLEVFAINKISDVVSFERMLEAIKQTETPLTVIKTGDNIPFTSTTSVSVLHPQVDTDSEDINEYSAVLKITHNGISTLVMADAGEAAELEIIKSGADIKCDILKVGHHGSSGSSSEKFLSRCKPSFAVISCGKDNEYGHPHTETMDRLEKRGITSFRTDISGSVVAEIDNEIHWHLERQEE